MNDAVSALRNLFEVLPDACIVVDESGTIVLANAAVRRVFGYLPDELIGRDHRILVPQRHREKHAQLQTQFMRSAQAAAMSARPSLPALAKSGDEVPVSIALATIELGGARYAVAIVRDATPARTRPADAPPHSPNDSLTTLGNRLALSRRMQRAIAAGRPFALLVLNLTRFRQFNEQHGHRIGDEILRMVARRIQSQVRADDLAVRIGGDEFAVLLDGVASAAQLEPRAAALADGIAQPFRVSDVSGTVGVNVGGALFPRDGRSEDDLLLAANLAMYRAKRSNRAFWIEPGGGATKR
jgi:diguanylate cyclase (GGDEF)-like protein/PAS domain S-box-containing protein